MAKETEMGANQPLGEEDRDVLQTEIQDNKPNIYATVLPFILDRLAQPLYNKDNKGVKSLAEDLNVRFVQMRDWLKRAVTEGKVIKIEKPVRYVVNGSAIQLSLFKEDRDVLQTEIQDNKPNIYATVLPFILDRLARPLDVKDVKSLAKDLNVQDIQMQDWLDKAVAEGKVKVINTLKAL